MSGNWATAPEGSVPGEEASEGQRERGAEATEAGEMASQHSRWGRQI